MYMWVFVCELVYLSKYIHVVVCVLENLCIFNIILFTKMAIYIYIYIYIYLYIKYLYLFNVDNMIDKCILQL